MEGPICRKGLGSGKGWDWTPGRLRLGQWEEKAGDNPGSEVEHKLPSITILEFLCFTHPGGVRIIKGHQVAAVEIFQILCELQKGRKGKDL